MDYNKARACYLDRQIALKDWYRIIIRPGTGGKITSIIESDQGDLYLSVKLHDTLQSEEQFKLDDFHHTFRVVDH